MKRYKKIFSSVIALSMAIVPIVGTTFSTARISLVSNAEDTSDTITVGDMTFQGGMTNVKALALTSYTGNDEFVVIPYYIGEQNVSIVPKEVFDNNPNVKMIFQERAKSSDELTLLYYKGNDENVIVPETVNGKTVKAIYAIDTQLYTGEKVYDGESIMAFENNQTIKNVILPDTIDYFLYGTFRNSSLVSINIPKSLRVIPNDTFAECKQLESVEFHDNILCISETAFENSSFTDIPDNIYLGYSYTSYDKFRKRNEEWSFTIDAYQYDMKNIDKLGDYHVILEYCLLPASKIVDLVIPEELEGLPVTGDGLSFSSGSSLVHSIEFPKYFQHINFIGANRSALEKIVIKCSNAEVGNFSIWASGSKGTFEGCENLKDVIFEGEGGDIIIGNQAFKGCSSLQGITFPQNCNSVTIGHNAFEDTDFQDVDIKHNCIIRKYAFKSLSGIESANFGGNAEINAYAFGQCENLKEVSIAGVATLSNNAFYNCTAFENLNIDTSQIIDGSAFNGCTSFMTINGEQVFDSETNDLNPKYKDFVTQSFKTATDVGFLNLYVTEQMKKVVAENTTDDMTDIQKVKALHDWVCNNTVYNAGNEEIARTYNDAAILLNDTTVCEGYARTMNLLLNAAGIESYYVHSTTHAWNIVKLGGHYFHVDSTWDDGDNISYNYFLKSDSEISAETNSHAKWTLFKPSSLHSFQGTELPICEYAMGDMNTDGSVSVADLVLMNKYLLGTGELNADDYVLSDLNFDGRTDAFDMVKMRKLLTEQ